MLRVILLSGVHNATAPMALVSKSVKPPPTVQFSWSVSKSERVSCVVFEVKSFLRMCLPESDIKSFIFLLKF